MFKVYDKVWIMENNKPKQKMIFAVVESMAHFKKGTETHYRLVDGTSALAGEITKGCAEKLRICFLLKVNF